MESTISEEFIDTSSIIESLPTEILQQILGYLPVRERIRAERVCKRWKDISTEEVWKDVQILRVSGKDNNGYIRIDLESKAIDIASDTHYEKSIESIQLKPEDLFINFNESRIIQSLLSRCGRIIEKLIFNMPLSNEASGQLLSIITTYCHNIEDIKLNEISRNHEEYSPVSDFGAFLWLLQVNNKLQSVSYNIEIFEILPLKNWKSLHITFNCSVKRKWEDQMIAIIRNSPSLENLELDSWTPNVLLATSECKKLKELTISNDFQEAIRNDMTIEMSLMNNLKILTCLFAPEDKKLENNTIELIKKSPSLEILKIGDCTTSILAAIPRCKQLKSFTISRWRRKADDNDMIEMPLMNNLKILKWQRLNSPMGTDDKQIIDSLSCQCVNLEDLRLHYPSQNPSPLPLETQQAILALPKLNSLYFAGISMTDEILLDFVNLKCLGFKNDNCTEDGILKMIMNSECLEKLYCSTKITVEFLKKLVENTRDRRKILKFVTLKVTDEMYEVCKNSKIHLIQFLYLGKEKLTNEIR